MAELSDEVKREQIEANYERARRKFPEVPEVSAEELPALRERERVVLVDVRTPDEQAVSMIPGAITSQQFEQTADAHRDTVVVVYCTVGHRSGLYAKALQAKGWNVRNLKGAILSWTHAGGELIDADGPTRRLHVFNKHNALQASGYEPAW